MSGKLLRNYLKRSRSKRICIILDCCYAGAFGDKGMVTGAEFDDDIRNNLSAEGNVILMSASPTQRSKEDEVVGHGIFTDYLLEGLKSGSADQDDNGLITPIELHTYIKNRMAQDGRTEQKVKTSVKNWFRNSSEVILNYHISPKNGNFTKTKNKIKKISLIEI